MSIQNGKKPLSQKKAVASSPINTPADFMNPMSLPPALAAELKAKGLVPHWVNSRKLYENQGYHEKGWVPYRSDAHGKVDGAHSIRFGQDPDGIIRRGDCILAVKSEEAVEKHKAYLKHQADLRGGVQKREAANLRQMARDGGVEMDVHEGYEENEG